MKHFDYELWIRRHYIHVKYLVCAMVMHENVLVFRNSTVGIKCCPLCNSVSNGSQTHTHTHTHTRLSPLPTSLNYQLRELEKENKIFFSLKFLFFLNDSYSFHDSWFTVFCQFLLYSKVTQSHMRKRINY